MIPLAVSFWTHCRFASFAQGGGWSHRQPPQIPEFDPRPPDRTPPDGQALFPPLRIGRIVPARPASSPQSDAAPDQHPLSPPARGLDKHDGCCIRIAQAGLPFPHAQDSGECTEPTQSDTDRFDRGLLYVFLVTDVPLGDTDGYSTDCTRSESGA